ncbi:putative membrane protein [Lentzea californiensis]|nr:putative membrane protein [Lentzea californiensis]
MTAAVLWALGSTWYLISEAVAASAFPNYSYSHDYISDLGAVREDPLDERRIDSPLAEVMNLGFLHQGLFFLLGAVFLARALPAGRGRPAFLVLAVVHAAGNGLVATFHSGHADDVSAALHPVGAVMAILGGNLATITAALLLRDHAGTRIAGFTLSGIGLTSLLALGFATTSGTSLLFDVGTWERGSVYAITTWQLVAATVVLTTRCSRTGEVPVLDRQAEIRR